MVVNGCPDIKEIHAQGIAEFAMDIINETGRVKSPATGQSLQVRKVITFYILYVSEVEDTGNSDDTYITNVCNMEFLSMEEIASTDYFF